ncbi:MAG: hypothetical protein OIN86_00480 [Candidatus Methanoperedens sp.]|nr:hypothetical protein [Candidatus Methanoperedens sp.]
MMKNLDMCDDEIFSPGSWLKSQNSAIPATAYEMASPSGRGTRMTRIGRISTDTFNPCASASSSQSTFYCLPSAFYCVHPRLISNRKTQEALAR